MPEIRPGELNFPPACSGVVAVAGEAGRAEGEWAASIIRAMNSLYEALISRAVSRLDKLFQIRVKDWGERTSIICAMNMLY